MKVNNRDRDELFINERIRDREVRVISADGEQLGIMSSREALRLAEEANLEKYFLFEEDVIKAASASVNLKNSF